MILASSLTFFVFVFLLGSIATGAAWMVFLKARVEASEAAKTEPAESPETSSLLREEKLSTITFWDSILGRFDFIAILKTHLEQADLDWSVGRVTSMMLLCGVTGLAMLLRFLPWWASTLGGAALLFAPYSYILGQRNRRFRKFRENFPDVLDSLARALRAGYPLSAAMEMVTLESPPPISEELRKTATEANLGRGWPQALENFARRVPLLEVNLFISAVQLHSRTGGKLSEVMQGLAENMRESLALQGEVRALAAHGKLTGAILTILPVGIATMMLFVSPDYMSALFNHPWGKNLIAAAVGCLVLAHFVIRKLVDIKI
jgi:tight adherence protein B